MPSLNDYSDDALLSAKEASQYIPLSRMTLHIYRHQLKGPVCIRRGGRYFYKVKDLKDYLKGEIVTTNSIG
jgi:predicted site-specific integrase-resolvase